jgi:hypothetical protein
MLKNTVVDEACDMLGGSIDDSDVDVTSGAPFTAVEESVDVIRCRELSFRDDDDDEEAIIVILGVVLVVVNEEEALTRRGDDDGDEEAPVIDGECPDKDDMDGNLGKLFTSVDDDTADDCCVELSVKDDDDEEQAIIPTFDVVFVVVDNEGNISEVSSTEFFFFTFLDEAINAFFSWRSSSDDNLIKGKSCGFLTFRFGRSIMSLHATINLNLRW